MEFDPFGVNSKEKNIEMPTFGSFAPPIKNEKPPESIFVNSNNSQNFQTSQIQKTDLKQQTSSNRSQLSLSLSPISLLLQRIPHPKEQINCESISNIVIEPSKPFDETPLAIELQKYCNQYQ